MAAAAAGVRNFQPRATIISRSKGGSVAGKAAYNARTRIVNGRDGRIYDWSRHPNEAISTHFFAPANAPEWAMSREDFWNAVELREKRTDSQLALDWIIPLPHELQAHPKDALLPLTDFIRENFQRKGYGADLALHPAHDHGDERNFHAHLMVSIRRIDGEGKWAAAKDGVPNEKELVKLRERMTAKLNAYMHKHGYEVELDCRSYEERGMDREPTNHLGKHAAALERRGVRTEVGDLNRAAEARNILRVELEQAAAILQPRKPEPEITPQFIASAIERQNEEDAAAQKRIEEMLSRRVSMAAHARELLGAVRRLFTTMGVALGNIMQIDPGDHKGQGAAFRTEAWDRRKRLEELEAASYRRHVADANARAAKLAAQAAEDVAQKQKPEKESEPVRPRVIFKPAPGRKLRESLRRGTCMDEDEPN